ncbi:hypothetical protein OG455_09905 [Kitasatospora sp. NBC_01287]|uniref:hypothetical protein n=1 Tax=Kitasatospora sp. NBC_01287 TaxID=2903573 RepID=UPI0022571FF9|nr:hypothetical protein [Kitasatospora sp. NBC_01287]MCX4745834.1 hypothetical protein [Kitasatospora sp. NBC_01287]
MTTPSSLSTEDQAMSKALASLEKHGSAMITSGQTVEQINQEIRAHYISGASSSFQGKVQDWVDRYKTVMNAFQQLTDALDQSGKFLAQAEADAHDAGGNWGASENVYHLLNGTTTS